jgi:hypothetical protein
MTKNKLFILCTLFALFTARESDADTINTCEKQNGATPAQLKRYIQCLDAHLTTMKQEQQRWIKKRTYELKNNEESTGNTQILPLFISSIRSYEKFIDQSCQWRYILKMPNASAAAIEYKQCEIALIESFTEAIKHPL